MNTNPTTDLDLDVYDELDDFDSPDLDLNADDAGNDFLTGMWGGFRSGSQGWSPYGMSADVLKAHGMVQSFVNAFARDGRYIVTFDPTMDTAGTDMQAKRTTITPSPILDPEITAEEAGLILTGLAVHEICHPRYGRRTRSAVQRAFPNSSAALRISNILDDVRIERRFVADYPGYAGVFQPLLDYVGKGTVKRNGGQLVKPSLGDQLNLMTAALRYPSIADWTGLEAERAWWTAWADRWSREDAPKRHVAAVREALQHIVAQHQQNAAPQPQPGPTQSDEQQGQQGDGGQQSFEDDTREDEAPQGGSAGAADEADQDDAQDEQSAGASDDAAPETDDDSEDADDSVSDGQLGTEADAAQTAAKRALPTCTDSKAVDSAARESGVDRTDINDARREAQEAVKNAEFYEDDGTGQMVDVARSLRGLHKVRTDYRRAGYFQKSDLAARYIRDALLRSRTGHTNVSHYQKRGRLDQQGLHRVASRDFRLFDRKTAESPGKYLVWVMVDRSSSMNGSSITQAAQVATALADASQHVPNLRMAVWAWSDSFRGALTPGVAKAWESGQPSYQIAQIIDLVAGFTPDATVMRWAQRAIRRETRGGEQPVILMCSDGIGDGDMNRAVEEARAAGVIVRSVSLGHAFKEEHQLERYGKNGYVTFRGSILETARPLAAMIARMVQRGAAR